MQEVSATTPNKPYVPPKTMQVPVFIEFTPEYEKEHGLSKDIDRIPQNNQLERTPDEDGFCASDAKLLGAPTMNSFKVPTGPEIIATIVLTKEIFGVLNDAIKAGRNLWETLADWVGNNDKLSDKEKVQAMQLGNVMAKQMSVKEAA